MPSTAAAPKRRMSKLNPLKLLQTPLGTILEPKNCF